MAFANCITLATPSTTMSSREIAELTGKRHDNVLRDIEAQLTELLGEGGLLNFEGTYRHEQNGQEYREYRLPKRECLIVVSGYSVELRARIIDRWMELESQNIPQTFAQALQLAADQARMLEAMQPKAEYCDRLLGTHGTIDLETAAKTLRTSRPKMVSFLKERGVLTEKCLPMQVYIERDYMRVQLTTYQDVYGRDQISQKTVITQPGLMFVRGLLDTFERDRTKLMENECNRLTTIPVVI
jgi:anti-repressor protein